jgi:predicted DNA-binding protein (MmcQ/YjbR family)
MPPRPLVKLRKVCLALPEAHEVESHGEPTFRVKNKMFAMFANANNHHGAGRHGVWLKSTPAEQKRMVRAAPEQYFVPPYVGKSGWVGAWLDGQVDWEAVSEFVREAYKLAAPERLSNTLGDR